MRAEYEVMDGTKYPIIWRKKGKKNTDPCPYCEQPHTHGIGEGHRVAHCVNTYSKRGTLVRYSDSYEYRTNNGEVINKSRGYILREYYD